MAQAINRICCRRVSTMKAGVRLAAITDQAGAAAVAASSLAAALREIGVSYVVTGKGLEARVS
jgi:hypothetical protein